MLNSTLIQVRQYLDAFALVADPAQTLDQWLTAQSIDLFACKLFVSNPMECILLTRRQLELVSLLTEVLLAIAYGGRLRHRSLRIQGWSGWRESSVDCRVWQTLNLLLLNDQYGVTPVTHSVHPI
ncbi:hypothetical protein [Nostoc sp. ATCC 53789]|uniref:hypothetical protein n=1 Tax=Nostoc sp. ATCC 53789 TaxID=76335 RepID=UPI000DECCD12|nr:hypothetical protein [Nostoc sp. ATCC 53789]QHG16444.1 hypothetical protein GJB62_10995 [Nostoc sp. ATCC 53789]RCJ30730.1 hypothetical protein A6V25_14335 [Nostoc sp. ATCC 53789]